MLDRLPTVDVSFPMTKAQRNFMLCENRGAIFFGGRGAGKTFTLGMWAANRAMQSRRVEIVADTYKNLEDYVLDTLVRKVFKILGLVEHADYEINHTKLNIDLWGGQILLRSADKPDDLRGPNIHDFAIDEARQLKNKDTWLVMIGCIREAEDGQWRIGSTTKGKNWVYELSHRFSTFIQDTFANPFTPESYKDEVRREYTGQYARQELYADTVEWGAGIIVPGWFKVIPPPVHDHKAKLVRFWDLAVSTKTAADESAGAKCSLDNGRFTIWDIQHGRLAYPDLRRAIVACANEDGPDCLIIVEEAGQQLGFINDLQTMPELAGYTIMGRKPAGDKYNRVIPWAARAEAGFVDVVEGHWKRAFFDQCEAFTADDSHEHDDLIDAVSGGYQECAVPVKHYHIRTLA
jgi:predicted phage terminase large subunit-like protein